MSLKMKVLLIICAAWVLTAGSASAANPLCPAGHLCVRATELENQLLVLVDLTPPGSVTTIFATPGRPDSLVLDTINQRLIYSESDVAHNDIRRYDPVANTDTQLANATVGISTPLDMILDPTGQFLYTSNFANSTITKTDLTIAGCTPVCTGTTTLPLFNILGPEGLAFDSAGNLFVLAGFHTAADGIYRIDKNTGAVLQMKTGIDAPNNELDALTFDPSTNFLFATSSGQATGSNAIYRIDPGTLNGVKIATVPQPDGIINDSHGTLYVASRIGGAGNGSVYSVNELTGVPTQLTPVPTIDDLGIVPAQPPVGLKTFTPKTGPSGFTSTLTIQITNPNPVTPLTNISFTDNLPAGVVITPPANPPPFVNTCGGTITFAPPPGPPGPPFTSFSLSGGTLAGSVPPSSCTVSLSVTDNNPAPTVSQNCVTVMSQNGGPGNQSCDSLTVVGVPDLAITKTHVGSFTKLGTGAYTITVTNTGTAPLGGTTTVVDTLPLGLTATAISGAGWNCVLATLTCMRADALAAGAPYPPITLTVSVACGAAALVTNTATVTNPTIAFDDPDDVARDQTTILDNPLCNPPDLAITKTHVGNFTQGQMGATYTITVTNTGGGPTVGTTTVVDTLPAGLTFVSGMGGGFTCNAAAQMVTCTNLGAIAAGASAVITLTVNVAANAALGVVTNTAMVTNPTITGDPDDTAADPTNIVAPPPPAEADTYQLRYFANLDKGDSYVNLTNAGTLNGFDPAGRLCVNVYTFDPAEELISCCACPVTPNGLASLSVRNDLISNTLTPGVPTSVTVKLLSSLPLPGNNCNAASPNAANLVRGMRAWATTIHLNTAILPAPGVYQETETPFSKVELSPSELSKLTSFCGFIQANGSGFGICKSCSAGALGAVTK